MTEVKTKLNMCMEPSKYKLIMQTLSNKYWKNEIIIFILYKNELYNGPRNTLEQKWQGALVSL